MGRLTPIAAAFALMLATGAGAQSLQELPNSGAGPATAEDGVTTSDGGAMTQEEAIAATPDDPAVVPSAVGGLANAGTMSDAALGQPLGGYNIQPQVTALGKRADGFNIALLSIMAVVTLFVFGLLAWAMLKFRRKSNPVPSKTTHNVLIEVLWTVVPVLILVGIAVPSFALLLDQYDPPEADVTVKAIGHQWYWEYEYPDEGGFAFDAIMLSDEEAAAANEPRLLATDNRVVVPVGATVKVLVTSVDVIHSWAMPAFWVKMDAVPGKINETWFNAEQTGVYYGQCSELCGTRHAFMPIVVEVVEPAQYAAWVAARQEDAGIDPTDLVEEEIATADEPDVPTVDAGAGGEMSDLPTADTAPPAGTVVEQSNTESAPTN